ncbi:hypothetical protein ACLOJK_008636 [Asimina triloba]
MGKDEKEDCCGEVWLLLGSSGGDYWKNGVVIIVQEFTGEDGANILADIIDNIEVCMTELEIAVHLSEVQDTLRCKGLLGPRCKYANELYSREAKKGFAEIPKPGYAKAKSAVKIGDGGSESDDFRMYMFKIKWCSKSQSHDWIVSGGGGRDIVSSLAWQSREMGVRTREREKGKGEKGLGVGRTLIAGFGAGDGFRAFFWSPATTEKKLRLFPSIWMIADFLFVMVGFAVTGIVGREEDDDSGLRSGNGGGERRCGRASGDGFSKAAPSMGFCFQRFFSEKRRGGKKRELYALSAFFLVVSSFPFLLTRPSNLHGTELPLGSPQNCNAESLIGLMCELLWSDPQPNPGRGPSKRGVGLSFGGDVTKRFLKENNLDLVVRSHEVKDEGYEIEHDGRLITVFSAPNYCDQKLKYLTTMGNKGAFIRFKAPDMKPDIVSFSAVHHL